MGDHQRTMGPRDASLLLAPKLRYITGRFLNQWEIGLPIGTFALTEKATVVERLSTRRK
jgi:hypothetical protein